MNVYQKLNEARERFHQAPLKKSGHNKFANYYYFELGDFIIPALEIFKDVGLTSVISFGVDAAHMLIVNNDKPEETIIITSPMSTAALKGCHEVQNLGAVQTYLRRYLWVAALEIVEHDALDATTGRKGDAPIITPKGGIGDDLPQEDKEFLQETAQSVEELCKSGKASDALAMVDEMALESDQKVYLFGFLSAPTRAALKKAKPV
ncbi:erf superfamily [Caudoviricetes sp.]|nr:erf superfamily [Caudoviricetes sp.]